MEVDAIRSKPNGLTIRPMIQIIDDSEEWEPRTSEWKANPEQFAFIKDYFPKEFGDLEWHPELTF